MTVAVDSFQPATAGLQFCHDCMNRQGILFIIGPTASGKTELSLVEAQRRGGVILSCDSLCVYRGMDIGTAKPTAAEQARVPHFGIDLEDPAVPYSVARYIAYRDEVVRETVRAGQPLIVVGGSGFYLKSFFSPVTDRLPIPDSVEAKVRELAGEGLDAMVNSLRRLHEPEETFPGLDLRNPRRVEKALARCLAAGKSFRELQAAFASEAPPLADIPKEVWLIDRPGEVLQERNRLRVAAMLNNGLIEEVERLRMAGFEANPSACGAIGYREVLEMLDGRLFREQLAEQIFIHTRQLVRKQRTWFRKQIPVDRVIAE